MNDHLSRIALFHQHKVRRATITTIQSNYQFSKGGMNLAG